MSLAWLSWLLARLVIMPVAESLAPSARTDSRAAMPSTSMVSSGVWLTLSAPTPVVPPTICCARLGFEASATWKAPWSKTIAPFLSSWIPTVEGDLPPTAAETWLRMLLARLVSAQFPLSGASLPSLLSVTLWIVVSAVLAASISAFTLLLTALVSLATVIVVGVGVVEPLGIGLSADTVTETPVSSSLNVLDDEVATSPVLSVSFASVAAVLLVNPAPGVAKVGSAVSPGESSWKAPAAPVVLLVTCSLKWLLSVWMTAAHRPDELLLIAATTSLRLPPVGPSIEPVVPSAF